MINSTAAFPVEIVFATPAGALGYLGSVDLHLPLPDMVVTETRWDLFLPHGLDYRSPTSNMDVVFPGRVDSAGAGSGVCATAPTFIVRPSHNASSARSSCSGA